ERPPAQQVGKFDLELATALLLSHWTSDRHLLALAVSGALIRGGVEEGKIEELISRVCAEAHDEEPAERLSRIKVAAKAIEHGDRMFGAPTLRERLGADTNSFLAACGVYAAGGKRTVTLDDFCAYLPAHEYIFLPTSALWPAVSVNAQVPPIKIGEDEDGKDK